MRKIIIYDSILRDGAQAQGVSFTVDDKLKIVERLDYLGINYIEAGNPGSNPKDLEFFSRAQKLKLKNARIIAFGSTRRAGIRAEEDSNVKSLLTAGTSAVAIFGKSWDFQVTDIIRTTLEENLNMIADTVSYFKNQGKEVVFDAEHFFDGYKANPDYAVKTLTVAMEAGADSLCLCDTNGGTFTEEIFNITKAVVDMVEKTSLLSSATILKEIPGVGIHCHNDCGMAVANSVAAIRAGAIQVQGTINGLGERCGNADLCTIIPNLQLKLGFDCLPQKALSELTEASIYISGVANMTHNEAAPYVGSSAFSHKGGMHIDAVNKNPKAYEHIDPSLVGNYRRILMSEVAGRSTILKRIRDVDPSLDKSSPETVRIMERLKQLEHEGYQYENAESSFELVIRKELGKYKPFFNLNEFKVIVNEPSIHGINSSAIIKVEVDGQSEITASEGDGPVNALDKALRKALERFYPEIGTIRLTDFKVRVLDSSSATAAKVRVLIESADYESVWTTIGVSADIIDASWKALVDSIEYKLMKQREKEQNK